MIIIGLIVSDVDAVHTSHDGVERTSTQRTAGCSRLRVWMGVGGSVVGLVTSATLVLLQ